MYLVHQLEHYLKFSNSIMTKTNIYQNGNILELTRFCSTCAFFYLPLKAIPGAVLNLYTAEEFQFLALPPQIFNFIRARGFVCLNIIADYKCTLLV